MPSVILAKDGLRLNGRPFTIIGAELHNSSSSAESSIRTAFKRVADLGANTVLAPLAWDQFEPIEGSFDFSLIDAMIATARELDLRLIPLWFGSWKNATSSYAPSWVKTDADRFPRASINSRSVIEHISPFGREGREADARAFATLMDHLRAVDTDATVIMVQVENEVGLLGDSRDRSALADEAWQSAVPPELITAIAGAQGSPGHDAWVAAGQRPSGTWSDVLGDSSAGHEVFMAWAYATYVETVAAAGRAKYDIPLYVNAWLDSVIDAEFPEGHSGPALAGGMQPGNYPSGGPVVRVSAIWRAAAPSIDLLAPDIYFGDIDHLCSTFRAASGHLLIPEMRRSALGVAHMHLAVGQYGALGVSPFGLDSLEAGSDEEEILADGYRLVGAAAAAIRGLPAGAARGFILKGDDRTWSDTLGAFTLRAELGVGSELGYGIVVEERPGAFLVIGRGFQLTFKTGTERAGILAATRLDFDGELREIQRINGDETRSGSALPMHGLGPAPVSKFPIPIVSRSTGIARVELYSFG